jgi:hypothetical protein
VKSSQLTLSKLWPFYFESEEKLLAPESGESGQKLFGGYYENGD